VSFESGRPGGGLPCGKDRFGRQHHARIDQQRRQRRQHKRRGKYFADAAHDARAGIETDRHIGAGRTRRGIEVRIGARDRVRIGDETQRRGRIR
jgi:hypothetical protein